MARKRSSPLQGNRRLRETLLQVVDNQLRAGDPPEVKQTYDRLREMNYSDQETRQLIACAMLSEIYDILKADEPYNNERYVAALNKLPTLPWE